MFSTETHCLYEKNPVAEVICQFRFPEILTIEANLPVDFQEAIRKDFPRYQKREDKLPPLPGKQPASVTNHQFSSADGIWRVNLTSRFFSLACTRYSSWENFAGRLDRPLAAFLKIYQPAYYERVGLRYVNVISRKALDLEGIPFSQMIQPCYLGPLAEEDVSEAASTRCSIDCDLGLRGGCRAKIHAGPGMVKRAGQADTEVKFIFDQDLYMPGQVPIHLSAGALQTLHTQAFSIFRGAVTDLLHHAMEPSYQ